MGLQIDEEKPDTSSPPADPPSDADPPKPRKAGRPAGSPNKPKAEAVEGDPPIVNRRKAPNEVKDTLSNIKSRHKELNECIAHHNELHPEARRPLYPDPDEMVAKGEPKLDGDILEKVIGGMACGGYMLTVKARGKNLGDAGRELRLSADDIKKASEAWVEWSCYLAPGVVNPQSLALVTAVGMTGQIVIGGVMQGFEDPDPKNPTNIRDAKAAAEAKADE